MVDSDIHVQVERVDDVPLLLGHMKRMGLAEEVDKHLQPHGNWGSELSLGQTLLVWLSYLISRGDHRMNRVEDWARQLEETLQQCLSSEFRPVLVGDDRLGRLLRYLSRDEAWVRLEEGLNQRIIRVYDLSCSRVRVDMTTVSCYACTSADGLVQFGFSKDKRSDLPQVKVGLSALDPLGMPISSLVVPGNNADDPCYVPLIQQAHDTLGSGLLYIGDSKMAALSTRAAVHRQGDMYLCRAPRTVVSAQRLWTYVSQAKSEGRISSWEWVKEDGTSVQGEAFVVEVPLEDSQVAWTEERWVVRYKARHKREIELLENRLEKARSALLQLNQRGRGRRRYRTCEALAEQTAAILKRHEVEGLLEVTYRCEVTERKKRPYKGQPGGVERQEDWFVSEVKCNEQAVSQCKEELGWCVYLTNGKAQGHTLQVQQVVQAYREQYTVEQAFHRMKHRSVGITPMHLQRDDHRKGLIRLFTLALRVVTVLEYEVRRSLAQTGEKLYGLYAGNPKRGTHRPTAESLLEAFEGISLSIVHLGQQRLCRVTPLSPLHKEILNRLGLSETLYTSLESHLSDPP